MLRFGAVTIGLPTTSGGQRHSSETPTSESTSPRSAMISVALGSSEQILEGIPAYDTGRARGRPRIGRGPRARRRARARRPRRPRASSRLRPLRLRRGEARPEQCPRGARARGRRRAREWAPRRARASRLLWRVRALPRGSRVDVRAVRGARRSVPGGFAERVRAQAWVDVPEHWPRLARHDGRAARMRAAGRRASCRGDAS